MNERIGLVGTLTYVLVTVFPSIRHRTLLSHSSNIAAMFRAVWASEDLLFRDYSHIVWLQCFDRVEYRTPFANTRSFLIPPPPPPHTHTHTFDDIYFLAAKLQACTHTRRGHISLFNNCTCIVCRLIRSIFYALPASRVCLAFYMIK